jgi:hypothetical protein
MDSPSFREMATDALRYWELRRIAYNLLLVAIVLVYFLAHWPASQSSVNVDGILGLVALAVLANVVYCAAYPADLILQASHFREQRGRWRLAILVVGFLFAAIITRFFAMGLFNQG